MYILVLIIRSNLCRCCDQYYLPGLPPWEHSLYNTRELKCIHVGVSRGVGQGVLTPPLFLDPPFSCVTPPPTQPDLTDKCNVNCFLIV